MAKMKGARICTLVMWIATVLLVV